MRPIALIAAFLTTSALLCVVAASEPPSTAPSSQLKSVFAKLADPNPKVRESARVNLMGLSPSRLLQLRQVVAESRPLQPAQISVLRDIVGHVYLCGIPYTPDPSGRGFLGITLSRSYTTDLDAEDAEQAGVWVVNRMPGLCAYPVLEDNDVILRVAELPSPLNGRNLQGIIQSFQAGRTIHLEVQRAGRLLRVEVTLSARPDNIEQPSQDFRATREALAEQYWEENFAALVEQKS